MITPYNRPLWFVGRYKVYLFLVMVAYITSYIYLSCLIVLLIAYMHACDKKTIEQDTHYFKKEVGNLWLIMASFVIGICLTDSNVHRKEVHCAVYSKLKRNVSKP